MQAFSKLIDVRTVQTRSGHTRYVVKDADGREYTTFREEIGEHARRLEGRRVCLSYHEEQRSQYTNVYLDDVSLAQEEVPALAGADTDPQEAAWRTAVEAAPWLVGKPSGEVDPDELYEKLKPFEERVAQDIEAERDA